MKAIFLYGAEIIVGASKCQEVAIEVNGHHRIFTRDGLRHGENDRLRYVVIREFHNGKNLRISVGDRIAIYPNWSGRVFD